MESTGALSHQHSIGVGWRFWLQWVFANAFGFGIGFPLGVIIMLRTEGITDIRVSALVGILAWTLMGVSVGIMQWLTLRPVLSDARWIVATIIGWAAGLGVYIVLPLAGVPPVLPSFLTAPGLGLAYGAGAGLFQTLILRCSIRRAATWVLASGAGGAVGLALLTLLQPVLTALGVDFSLFASGAIIGTVSGAITGLALVWLLRPAEQAASLQEKR